MTAYSFGNRWVGITALRTPPPPEPLHKMALRLREKSLARQIQIDKGIRVPVTVLLTSLARIRVRMTISGLDARSQECLVVERSIRSGQTPQFRSWLQDEFIRIHTPGRTEPTLGPRRTPASKPDSVAVPSERILATGWARSYPQAPDSPWIPPASAALLQDLRRMDLELDEDALRWVRWACLHRSYLYESVPDSPISAEVLDLLAALGRGWMRMALLERTRSQYGDFGSNAEVSNAFAMDKHARSALSAWVTATGAAVYGKGEASMLAAGTKSTAPETVAVQILGALSLVTASQAPADGLLELVEFKPSVPEPDWRGLLGSQLRRDPTYTQTKSGPDHATLFTVTVEANGLSASGTGPSVKVARREAVRSYVLRHLPWVVPMAPTSGANTAKPLPYRQEFPQHVRARSWAKQAFEVADAGLISQTLTHRSWTEQNRDLVAEANQRDYGTLATEGAEALTSVIRHQYALHTLDTSFRLPASAVTSPALPRDAVVELFDLMPVAAGILRVRGIEITADIKADVAQAIIGAAWRANGDLLMERQPATFAKWVRAFTVAPDHTTQLQEYCARVNIRYAFSFERRGPDHQKEFRATITFAVDEQPRWHGDWRSATTPAKQSAAEGVLRYLLDQEGTEVGDSDEVGQALLRGILLAELRTIDLSRIEPRRELAAGRLGVDLLAAGAYNEYLRWARVRSQLLPTTGSAVAARLSFYYESVLKQQRREAVRHWIVKHTPTRGIEVPDAAERIRAWQASDASGLLALLEELLAAIQNTDPASAVLEYAEQKARIIAAAAHAALESEESADAAGRTLTLRVSGVELSDALAPVTKAIDSIVSGVTWEHESHAVSVTVPSVPTVTDPVSRSGVEAAQRALQDPWLERVRGELNSFLSIVEAAVADTAEPTSAQIEELVFYEHLLIAQLRTYGC